MPFRCLVELRWLPPSAKRTMNRTSSLLAGFVGLIMIVGPAAGQGVPQTGTIFRVDPVAVATGFRASKIIGATVVNELGDNIG